MTIIQANDALAGHISDPAKDRRRVLAHFDCELSWPVVGRGRSPSTKTLYRGGFLLVEAARRLERGPVPA